MTSTVSLLTCSENVSVWNLTDYSALYKLNHSTAKCFTTLAWVTDGQFVCVPSEEKKLMFCNLLQNELTTKEFHVGVNVSSIGCGHQSPYIAVGSTTGEVICWDKKQEKVFKTIAEVPSGVTSLQYSLNDSHIAVGCVNGKISIYNITSGVSSHTLKQDDTHHAVRSLHFHQKHKFILGSSYDGGQMAIWDLKKPAVYQILAEKHKAPAMDLKFSPFGNSIVASVGLDKRIFTHDIRQKSLVSSIRCEVPLRTLEFLPGGVSLVVGGSKGMVYTYDLRTSKMLNSFTAHTKPVQAISVCNVGEVKTKRDVKNRVTRPVSNEGSNSESCSSEPSDEGFFLHIPPLGEIQDNTDLRKHVLNKNMMKSPTILSQAQEAPRMQISSDNATNKDRSENSELDLASDVFSPPRASPSSDDKENFVMPVATRICDIQNDEKMETEEDCPPTTETTDSPVAHGAFNTTQLEDLRSHMNEGFQTLHMDVTSVCFQMLKQFTAQQIELQKLQERCEVNRNLVEEVQYLREENKRLKTVVDLLRNKC